MKMTQMPWRLRLTYREQHSSTVGPDQMNVISDLPNRASNAHLTLPWVGRYPLRQARSRVVNKAVLTQRRPRYSQISRQREPSTSSASVSGAVTMSLPMSLHMFPIRTYDQHESPTRYFAQSRPRCTPRPRCPACMIRETKTRLSTWIQTRLLQMAAKSHLTN